VTSYSSVVYPVYRTPANILDLARWTSDDGSRTVSVIGDTAIIRGGIWTMTLAHENAENIDYKVILIRMKDYAIASTTIDKALMPNFGDEPRDQIKIYKTWEGTLAPSTSLKLSHKLGIDKIDKFFNDQNKNQFAFVVNVGNTVTASAVPCTVVLSVAAWLCADVITP